MQSLPYRPGIEHTRVVKLSERQASWVGRLGAVVTLIVMCATTIAVWQNELRHDRMAVQRHAEDICRQSSRRLQIEVEGSLRAAKLFAQRWGAHEGQDHSRARFENFVSTMVKEVPGFHGARIVTADGKPSWVAPSHAVSAWQLCQQKEPDLLDRAAEVDGIFLSAPVVLDGNSRFFAVLPLASKPDKLENLIVEFDVRDLVDDGFRSRIRSEFDFEVLDGDLGIYQFAPEGPSLLHPHRDLGARHSFQIHNRSWRFEVVPRLALVSGATGFGNIPVLALGLLVSAGTAALVHLLGRRMNLYREARDQAMRQEEALRLSEERYRSVFASATDGLLLVGQDDRIVRANPAACRMHGFSEGELDGKTMSSLVASSSKHLYATLRDRPDASGVFRAEAAHVRADGSLIDVEVSGTRVRMGAQRHALLVVTDVTERRRAVQLMENLSRKVLMAQEEERARVSRELHDELGQLMTASRFELMLLQKYGAELPDEMATALARAIDGMDRSGDELRRICRGLRPPLLDDLGLEPAIQLLAEETRNRTDMTIDLDAQVDEAAAVRGEVALCAYRVMQESLNNIARHAEANSVDISLQIEPCELRLSVYDDGRGFHGEALGELKGVGIAGMRERASLVGGVLEVRSTPSQGTRVVLRIPLRSNGMENAS